MVISGYKYADDLGDNSEENSNYSTIAIRKIGSEVCIPCKVIKALIGKGNEITYNIVPEKFIDSHGEYDSNDILYGFTLDECVDSYLSLMPTEELIAELKRRDEIQYRQKLREYHNKEIIESLNTPRSKEVE